MSLVRVGMSLATLVTLAGCPDGGNGGGVNGNDPAPAVTFPAHEADTCLKLGEERYDTHGVLYVCRRAAGAESATWQRK